jgi:phage protein U
MAETPIIALGRLKFLTSTAAFKELARVSEYRWADQPRIANDPVLQFTGYGVETLTLPLECLPGSAGDAASLAELRQMAEAAQPLTLVDSKCTFHGQWVIKGINEKQSAFRPDGSARKIEFEVSLARYFR